MMKRVVIFCGAAFLLGCGSVKGLFEKNGNVKASSESPLRVRELRIRVIEDVVGCKELLDEVDKEEHSLSDVASICDNLSSRGRYL
jgi:hypothetical protein